MNLDQTSVPELGSSTCAASPLVMSSCACLTSPAMGPGVSGPRGRTWGLPTRAAPGQESAGTQSGETWPPRAVLRGSAEQAGPLPGDHRNALGDWLPPRAAWLPAPKSCSPARPGAPCRAWKRTSTSDSNLNWRAAASAQLFCKAIEKPVASGLRSTWTARAARCRWSGSCPPRTTTSTPQPAATRGSLPRLACGPGGKERAGASCDWVPPGCVRSPWHPLTAGGCAKEERAPCNRGGSQALRQ